MKITNNLNAQPAYVLMATEGNYRPKEDRIGVTGLIISPLIRQLQLNRWDEIVVDVADMLERLDGIAWHEKLEPYVIKTGGKAEVKWELPIDGLTLVGKVDADYGNELQDHKKYKAFAFCRKAYKDTISKIEAQLNVLRYLKYACEGKVAEKLTLCTYIKDFSANKALQEDDYPKKIDSINIKVWDMEEAALYIRQRLALHKRTDYTCSDEDKWVRPECWAVMKKDGKKAERLLNTLPEAEAYIVQRKWTNDYATGKVYVEQRKTQPINCLNYCPARSVCDFTRSL